MDYSGDLADSSGTLGMGRGTGAWALLMPGGSTSGHLGRPGECRLVFGVCLASQQSKPAVALGMRWREHLVGQFWERPGTGVPSGDAGSCQRSEQRGRVGERSPCFRLDTWLGVSCKVRAEVRGRFLAYPSLQPATSCVSFTPAGGGGHVTSFWS